MFKVIVQPREVMDKLKATDDELKTEFLALTLRTAFQALVFSVVAYVFWITRHFVMPILGGIILFLEY